MSAPSILRSLFFSALLALVLAAPLRADMTISTLASTRTTTGATAAIHAVASAPGGLDRWSFQVHLVGAARARLEESLDGGTFWAPRKPFLADEIAVEEECGGCRFRIFVTNCPAGSSVSAWVVQSGALIPTVTP